MVNGPFTGTKERRSFKPKVASSILVGRIRELGHVVGPEKQGSFLCSVAHEVSDDFVDVFAAL